LAFGALEAMIEGAVSQRDDPSGMVAAARASWALVHGIAMLLVDGRIGIPSDGGSTESAEQLTQEVMTVLGRGLRSL
jgi:hypothetical protein